MSKNANNLDPWLPEIWSIASHSRESHDTFSIALEKPPDSKLPHPKPGQFNMLYAFGIGEIPISFSKIEEDMWHHTIRDVGAVSKALAHLQPGEKIGVRGPYGTFWDASHAENRDVVIIAGGVGMAPLKPLVDHVNQNRMSFGRAHLLYGARDPSNVLFPTSLEEWTTNINVKQTVDSATSEWRGHVGVVTNLLDLIDFNPDKTTAYVCGPDIMMRFSVLRLLELGVSREKIYVSLERNMKCAIGFCGHCQYGGDFICKDGAVFRYDQVATRMQMKEL